jgi:hypothetical protein
MLQTAVEGLANEIRAGLKNSLEELVTRAVTQEINKVKNSKNFLSQCCNTSFHSFRRVFCGQTSAFGALTILPATYQSPVSTE